MLTTYTATTGLMNDKTGKSFKKGDPIKKGDFTQKVIRAWLADGTLTMAGNAPAPKEESKPDPKPETAKEAADNGCNC